MSSFIHSTIVPRIYKVAAVIARLVQEKGQSVKELVFSNKYKHYNTKALYALVVETIHHLSVLDQLLSESKLIIEEPRLDPWLARILITELMWGKKTLPPNVCKPITTVLNHHDTFIGILKAAVRDGTHQNEPRQNKALSKPRYVRVNTLSLSVGDAVTEFRREGWTRATASDDSYSAYLDKIGTLGDGEYLQDIHVKEVFVFPPRTEFHQHELYTGGSLVLQDKATALAAFLLDPPPGSNVLDMCAAPGLKTTQLAAIMKDKGTLYAVEKNAKRYKTMCEFVERHGVTCVKTINADATTLTPLECRDVEYILVDPTCSGSGMPSAIAPARPQEDRERIQNLAKFQIILLERALTNFPKVKRVVYSTCSTFHEENEQVVEKILKTVNPNPESPNFQLMDLPISFTSRGSSDYECGRKCLLFNEAQDKTTGFFVAVFERIGEASLSGLCKRQKGKKHKVKANIESEGMEKNGDGSVWGTENNFKKGKRVKEGDDDIKIEEDVGKSKNKKRKREQEKEEVVNEVQDTEEEPSKTKKAKKGGGEGEEVVNEVEDTEEPSKKKKHKKDVEGDKEELISVIESKDKSKRKKKEKNADQEVITEGVDEKPMRKKKKKRRNNEGEGGAEETVEIVKEEIEEKETKKKKKRKNEGGTEEAVEVVNGEIDDKATKKEKKKRKNEGGTEETVEASNEEIEEKETKKKKKRKNEGGTEEAVEPSNVEIDDKATKKKKKRKHTKDDE